MRSLTKQEALPPQATAPTPPVTLLLDLDDNGVYYEMDKEVTMANLKNFLADFEAGSLKRKQCGD